MTVLRRAYVPVEPDVSGFDAKLREKFARVDPGGKAGKQLGGQLNRALKRLDLDPIDIKADPKQAFAALGETERRLRALSSNASTVEIKVQAERGLAEIGRFRRGLGEIADDGDDQARGFMARFAGRLGPLIATMPIQGPMAAAIGGAALSAAPLVSAAVAGGIIGGVGVGGVIGGMSIAARDERVAKAANDLAETLNANLEAAAGSFVQPTIAAIKEIQAEIGGIDLAQIFRDSSRYIPLLTGGVTSAIGDMGDAIEKLVANAGPAVDAIATGIMLIGDSVGDGLESLSDNGQSAGEALYTLFGIVDMGVDSTFALINAFTELYEIGQKVKADFVLQTILRLGELAGASDKAGEAAKLSAGGFAAQGDGIRSAGVAAEVAKRQQEELAAAQKTVKAAQDALNKSIASFAPQGGQAGKVADALQRSYTNLYGTQQAATDANETYHASWDDLSEAVKANKATLDIHTVAGRTNRDALQGLLKSNNDVYFANLNAGVSIDKARQKHENRTKAIREEARRLGLNREETQRLINTYGKIPGRKETDLVLDGMAEVARQLRNLYLAQRALAEGKTINEVRYEGTAAMRSLTRAEGGPVFGPGTATSDSVPAMLSNGEYVIKASSVSKLGAGALDHINSRGELPAFARGGLVAPVDTSRRWPFEFDVSDSFVMSKKEALAKVVPAIPRGGATGPFMERLLERMFGVSMISGFRPGARTLSGSRSYHALNRAVDFPPVKAMAAYMDRAYGPRLKEAITPYQQYNRLNGRRHHYTGAVWNQHNFAGGNAHNHFAMDDGGLRILQPGMNLVANGTGRGEPIAGPAAMAAMAGNNYNITVQVPPTAHPAEVGRQVVAAIHAFERGNGTRWRQ